MGLPVTTLITAWTPGREEMGRRSRRRGRRGSLLNRIRTNSWATGLVCRAAASPVRAKTNLWYKGDTPNA